MTKPWLEPRLAGPLANTLLTGLMSRSMIIESNDYVEMEFKLPVYMYFKETVQISAAWTVWMNSWLIIYPIDFCENAIRHFVIK